jgi:hypothetical protein
VDRRSLAAAAVLLLGACGPTPTPSLTAVETSSAPPTASATPSATPTGPTASPTASASPAIALNIEIKIREHCGSFGGCAIYGSLIPDGATSAEEVLLDAKGQGLPPTIGAGAYVVRFRLVAVSDDRAAGVPPDETTITTCESSRIDVSFQSAVNLRAAFQRASCRVTGTYTVTIID